MEGLSYIRNYVLFTMDTGAYEMMVKDAPEQRHLAYSLYMADRCSYPMACYQVYEEISETIDELENMELRYAATQMAIRYLKKGATLKDQRCTFVLAQMYIKGDHVFQDTVLGRKYLEQVVAPEFVEADYMNIKKSEDEVFLPSNIGRYAQHSRWLNSHFLRKSNDKKRQSEQKFQEVCM